MEKIKYVYLTENLINGKKYIGQHTGYVNDSYLGSGKLLKWSIEKYGRNNFNKVILEVCKTNKELRESEIKWIIKFNAVNRDDFYNLSEGGYGGNTLKSLTQEDIDKRSDKYRAWIAGMSENDYKLWIKRRSKAAKKVRKNKELELQRINAYKKTYYNKTEEEKKLWRDKIRGGNNYQAISVKTPFGVFETASDAAKAHGVCSTTITNRCKNDKFPEWSIVND